MRLYRHADWIRNQLRSGSSASGIQRELERRGDRIAPSVVRDYVRGLRAEIGLAPTRPNHPSTTPRSPPPTARRLSVAIVRRPQQRTDEEQGWVDQLGEDDPDCRNVIDLADEFAAMVRNRKECELTGWLERAEKHPSIRGFAERLRQDEAAVRASLSLPWSNGPVEGAVGRLKFLKRQMYGRAGFTLLKARVLNAA